tara:strand:- start:2840 stop:3049 length:210 start_codon:yes stop_codon:yes gene_type:complete
MDELNRLLETLELSDILEYCCLYEDSEEIISYLAKGGHKTELDFYRKFIKEHEEKIKEKKVMNWIDNID